ncbi:hypothetical protein KUTeg_007087 [Tegillarca granosa]|uniref:Fibronectin type-III domain-containing protein n=1 Tax=Tegillarca granosa TaxID=220873 RepID=A0ABQ9FGE0_TEGGR|nr:hypothetical protein KUTeg_007087 [Tegillarca granosa]
MNLLKIHKQFYFKIPSKPLTPRVYVTQHKDSSTSQNSLAADFRWSTPTTINGVITKHIVYHWTSDKNGGHKSVELPATNRHFILNGLLPNSSYHFQVSACTAVGCGEKSDAVKAKADAVNPVPKLLRVTKASIVLTEVDSGGNVSIDITTAVESVALSFLAQDDRMFWINKEGSLIEWNKNDNNQVSIRKQNQNIRKNVELMQLNRTGYDLSLDWISRTLFITEADSSGQTGSIQAYQIDQRVQTELVTGRQTIRNIVADPYRSRIYKETLSA